MPPEQNALKITGDEIAASYAGHATVGEVPAALVLFQSLEQVPHELMDGLAALGG